jgi:hypothetical protein
MDFFSTPTKENCKPLEAASKKAKEDFDACQKAPSPATTTPNPVASVPGQTGQPAQPVAVSEKKGLLGFGFLGLGGKKSKKTCGGKKSKSQKHKKTCGGKKSRSQKSKKTSGGKKSRSQKKH